MKRIGDKTVDMVLTDPPYGTTACKWDSVIPFEPMWKELKRICSGPILLFGSEPFSSALRMSNIKNFNYDWVWLKNRAANISSKKQPMKHHETISCFGEQRFFGQRTMRSPAGLKRMQAKAGFKCALKTLNSKPTKFYTPKDKYDPIYKNPMSTLNFGVVRGYHPTQKPVPLLEYLIKTYTLEGETVLDFTMGSGSTGVACKNLNRKFIGIEKDKTYFEIAKARINGAKPSVQLDMINV